MSSNQEWMRRLQSVECRDSTYKPKMGPLVFSRAQGSFVWDTEGKRYVDLCAGFGALALGHNSVALRKVAAQLQDEIAPVEHAMGDVYPSTAKIEFLEQIKSVIPAQYTKGAVALSGGQAVEIALKTALLATRKSGFIVFDDAYHGLDLGVLPLTARQDFKQPFLSWLASENVLRLPYGASKDAITKACETLSSGPGLAAIVCEPLQGRAGVNCPPDGWLQMLPSIARAYDGLVIVDDIFAGFGRVGRITSAEICAADLICFGKAIGGGFPISACFGTEKVMQAWPESPGEALHTGTFFGHSFSAAVGVETIKEIIAQRLVDRSLDLGQKAMTFLRASLSSSAEVTEIRGLGLMIGIAFRKPGHAATLMDELRQDGIIVLPSGRQGDVLSLTPALNIEETTFMEALNVVCKKILKH